MADSHKSLLQQEQEQDDHADQLHSGVLRIKEQAGLIKRELDDQNIILERLEEDVDKAEGNMSSLNRKMHRHRVRRRRQRPHAAATHARAHAAAARRGRKWAAGADVAWAQRPPCVTGLLWRAHFRSAHLASLACPPRS